VTRRILCSIGTGRHEQMLEITRPVLERYALRHAYDLELRTRASSLDRPPAWSKVVMIRELLEQYDTVVWIDADAIVVDLDSDVASHGRCPVDLVTHVIRGIRLPNAGVCVWRRSRAADVLLDQMWAQRELVEHRWWENAALLAVLGGDPDLGLVSTRSRWRAARTIGRLDPRWNSVPGVAEVADPGIVHLAGWPDDERIRVLSDLAARTLAGI
jgi:hypothetical protein